MCSYIATVWKKIQTVILSWGEFGSVSQEQLRNHHGRGLQITEDCWTPVTLSRATLTSLCNERQERRWPRKKCLLQNQCIQTRLQLVADNIDRKIHLEESVDKRYVWRRWRRKVRHSTPKHGGGSFSEFFSITSDHQLIKMSSRSVIYQNSLFSCRPVRGPMLILFK